jgi:arylsulfatase A-like enzyme
MHSKKTFINFTLILSILVIYSCEPKPTENKPPNIVLVFTDDLGYGDLGCYGNPVINTPNIDKMACEGIRFTSFYAAASVCTPSRAALLTGRYPIRNTPYNFGPESTNGLSPEEITIAEILKEQGYKTGMIGKWHLGHKEEFLPTAQGFDSYYGLPYSNDMILPWCPWLSESDKLFMYENETPIQEIGFEQDDITVDYTNKAIDFINNSREEPFFLYLAHNMPHLPISTSKEFLGKSKGGLFGDVIETLDWSMGQVLEAIKKNGLDNNTIVIFTSDNGPWQNLPERMLQRGIEKSHSGSAGTLRGSKSMTYEGGFRVPAIIRWPNKIQAGSVSRETITTMDLFSTLATISGAQVPQDRKIDGYNILNHLKGENYSRSQPFFYGKEINLQAVRKGPWKLRVTSNDGHELFNLDLDPSERLNIAKENEVIVSELLKELASFANETGAKLHTPEASSNNKIL